MKVLVIDDSKEFGSLVGKILKKAGHTVHSAETGEEGVAACICKPPEVVFLDLQLPDISGLEVARRIKAGCRTDPAIIILSGHAPDLLSNLASDEVLFSLQKPMSYIELSDTLMGAINRVQGHH